jgi:hypothetical protein
MKKNDIYIDLDGNEIFLANLDEEAVREFYKARGTTGKQIVKLIPYRIVQDLSGRIAVATGMARYGDYRDELKELIRKHFPSDRAFCKATGISPTMLSHVLAGRKQLSLGALTTALERIEYELRFLPSAKAQQTG